MERGLSPKGMGFLVNCPEKCSFRRKNEDGGGGDGQEMSSWFSAQIWGFGRSRVAPSVGRAVPAPKAESGETKKPGFLDD